MLNLPVAMLTKLFGILLIAPFLLTAHFQQADGENPRVDVPYEGATVQGLVGIAGSTNSEGFITSEVFFGYSPVGEWFSIGRQTEPISNQVIANWDTTVITDGVYRIKVVVNKSDGSQVETVVNNIRVSNYTSTEGDAGVINNDKPIALPDYEVDSKATATTFPPNPASVSQADLINSVYKGVVWVAVIFLITGVYLGLRRLNK